MGIVFLYHQKKICDTNPIGGGGKNGK